MDDETLVVTQVMIRCRLCGKTEIMAPWNIRVLYELCYRHDDDGRPVVN